MPELRFDGLRGEWVGYSTARNDRTFLPADSCPLCPGGRGGSTEIPLDGFEVAVFENRFPAFGPDPGGDGPRREGCEVVVYAPEHHLTLAGLPVERVRLVVEAWIDRYLELGARPEVRYVYIFENKGEVVGVTLTHPHGQIYALPFVPPLPALELSAASEHRERTGRCLHCDQLEGERAGPRLVFEHGGIAAFVPQAARWPYELHLYPNRHATCLPELSEIERDGLAAGLVRAAITYDRHFGFSTPYVMALHQAPTDGEVHPEAHLHFEFYPPHRRRDRLKYLAGVELGAGTYVNDTLPEATAAELRAAVP